MITRKTLREAKAERGYLDAEKFDRFSDADIERLIADDPELAPPTESLLRLPNQVQQTVGERGIGVQVSGDGNTVTVYSGLAELALVRKHLRKAVPKMELELFRVDLRATTLVGRDDERADLGEWLASDREVSVRCITGRAGAGKTRLAIELCDHAERVGWTAGFAQYQQFPEFMKHAATWRWNRPTLVIVDYAAALARDLRAWLEILARPEVQSGGDKLRLLLLERHAERELGWWAELLRQVSFSDPAPDELTDPLEPIRLKSLSSVEERRSLLAEAMWLAGKIANIQPVPRPPAPGANLDFDRRLGDDTINNEPLYLMMAGAQAIRTGAPTALALTRIDLAERVASREHLRLNRLASQWSVPETLFSHLTMCVTLQGGCSAAQALQLVQEEQRAMGFPEAAPATVLVNRLAEALPMLSGVEIDAVRPDLIGEAFMLQGLGEHRRLPNTQIEILERAWRRADRKVAATLVRTAQDYAHGDADHCSVVWLQHLINQMEDLPALRALAGELPEHTLALRELAAIVDRRVKDALDVRVLNEPELRPLLGSVYNSLARRLYALGRPEPAMAAAAEAVKLCRDLAAQRPDAFRGNLAISLNSLAVAMTALGQPAPALAAAQEAVAILRELAARRPDAFRPNLAASLNSLAIMLSAQGRREAALEAAEEAVVLYRGLAARRPVAFRPDLAASLNTLANRLNDLGQPELALVAAEEAVAICRELATQGPDTFRSDLALTLAVQANCLDCLGRTADALASNAEAILNLSPAFSERPAAFRRRMAPMVQQYQGRCERLGREPDMELLRPVLSILRELDAKLKGSQDEH